MFGRAYVLRRVAENVRKIAETLESINSTAIRRLLGTPASPWFKIPMESGDANRADLRKLCRELKEPTGEQVVGIFPLRNFTEALGTRKFFQSEDAPA